MAGLDSYTFIIWFLVGVGFAVAELVAPGLILIFFALGAWLTAIVCLFSDIGLGPQMALFSAGSIISLLALRRFMKNAFQGKADSNSAESVEAEDIGKTAYVTRVIEPNLPGEVKYRGSFWKAHADEKIREDAPVKILGHMDDDSQALRVEAIR